MTSATGGWVRYGTDAATALRVEISRIKGAEPLAPVTVVVPSNQVGVSTRRLLASGSVGSVCGAGPGLIGVTFVTPYRLAELLGAAPLAEQGRRPVSVPILGAAVRQALAAEPGAFGPVAGHAATETALVAAHRELRDLDGSALDALAASSVRAGEVVRVHRATLERLAAGWYDEEDLMAAATSITAAGHTPAEVGAVVVHLPQRLSRHAADLLRTLGSSTQLSVIAGTTGVAKADAEVVRSVGRLGVDLGPPPDEPVLGAAVSVDRTRIITASDADDEVRAAVRTVVDAVRAGTSLDRIAVLYAAQEPYGRLLQHHLDAADVLANGSATLPLAGRLAGRTLLGLLALPSTGLRRQDVFAWLTGAPILHQGAWAPTTAWERISRDAGVVAGRADWDHRLQHLADRLNAQADRFELEAQEDEATDWRVTRDRRDAARALELRGFVLGLADRLAGAQAPSPWSDRVRWAKRLLADTLGGASRRTSWPEAERRAAERLVLALDRLAVLDDLEGPVGLDVFTRALTVELEADLGRVGRFGEGVLVGPVSMGVGVSLDLAIVVGMAEGTFPSTLRDDSLLPDEDRDAAGGQLPLRSGHVDRLHHQFLATLGGSTHQVLCIPKGDLRRSRERVPSRWVLDVASSLAGATWWSDDLLHAKAPWITHLASFDDAVRTASSPATDQEHRLRTLLARNAPRAQLQATAATVDGTLAAGIETVDARWSTAVTRFDGNLGGLPIPSPVERGTSATSLESWAKCPHGYFVQHVLRVQPVEQPEDALQITPIDRGNLVHRALESFIQWALDEERVPSPGQAWTAEDHDRLRAIATELCDEAEADGLTGRSLFWQRDRGKILADLDRFLHEDDTHRAATGASPVATELPFGIGAFDALAFPLGDGRSVPLRGMADRVDRSADGTLHVLDYKTGSTTPYRGLSPDDPHQGGRRLQLAVYGLAARQHVHDPAAPVRAEYWFTSSKGRFEKLGYDITDEVLAQVSAAMATIVDGIEGGLFAPHPQPHTTSPFTDCHACDPDGLGTTEVLRQWERKVGDPALARYLDLITPPEPEPALAAEEAS
ncbi:PD-(D/E)XK nuclease family protein [Aquihabitans sp. McL0605]|uniref:PD-(D/E)XK nuclease family protein n=1 Tax=Aquihabitans sp. McL0605 TaxID=3415671 RepID=UPI003CE98EAD